MRFPPFRNCAVFFVRRRKMKKFFQKAGEFVGIRLYSFANSEEYKSKITIYALLGVIAFLGFMCIRETVMY